MTDVFFFCFVFFAFCVNIDSDETFTMRKRRKKKKNRELLKRRINDGRSLSFGISCQNCGTLSPLQAEPQEWGKTKGGQNMTSKCPG